MVNFIDFIKKESNRSIEKLVSNISLSERYSISEKKQELNFIPKKHEIVNKNISNLNLIQNEIKDKLRNLTFENNPKAFIIWERLVISTL